MSDLAKVKEETKKTVRSILIACPGGLSVKQLGSDFYFFVGYELPFRKLGYSDLEDFMRDIPDTVWLSRERGELMVRQVSSEKTMHIEEMVKRQKPPPKSRRPGALKSRPTRAGMAPPRPRPRPEVIPPTVPAAIRNNIRMLLDASPSGLHQQEFHAMYGNRFGAALNMRQLRFPNLFEMMKSLRDVVGIKQLQSGESMFFSLSKQADNKNRAAAPINRSPRKQIPPRLQRLQMTDNTPRYQPPHKRATEVQPAEEKFKFPAQPTRQSERPSESMPLPKPTPQQVPDYIDYDCGVNVKLQMAIKQVLSKHPEGILSARFSTLFKETYEEDLPLKYLGYNSIIELMGVLPNIVTIERPSSKDWILFDACLHRETQLREKHKRSAAEAMPAAPPRNTAPPVPERMKETIRQVLQHHPQGVAIGEFPDIYKELTGNTLEVMEYGFVSIEAMLNSLKDVLFMQYKGQGRVLLYAVDGEQSPKKDLLINLHTKKAAAVESVRQSYVPMDAVGPGCMYTPVSVPGDSKYLPIYVCDVLDPSHFWIQIKGDNFTLALEDLMDDLENAYSDEKVCVEYAMAEKHIKVGQVCAAIFPEDENWHRGTVTSILDSDFVQIYYVDYGTTASVSKRSLKFLKTRYMKLPVQAIRARLSNLVAPLGQWTAAAKQRMLHLVSDRPLMAIITHISPEQTMSVCLCDTSGSEDVHINDLLITEGFAAFKADEVAEPISAAISLNEDANASGNDELSGIEDYAVSTELYAEGESPIRHLKYVELTPEYSVHLVLYQNHAHIISMEISNLLWPGKDMLRSLLRNKKLQIPRVVLSAEDQADIFEQFEQFEVPGTMDGDSIKSHITMYELSQVQVMLDLFEHPSVTLRAALQQQIDLFNPSDPYWMAEEDTDEEEEEEVDFSLPQLEVALQSLQFRRKKIIQNMTAEYTVHLVEELDEVESQLRNVKKRIEAMPPADGAAAERGSVHSGDSSQKASRLTDSDLTLTQIVAAQGEGYYQNKDKPKPGEVFTSEVSGKKTNPVAPMLAKVGESVTGAAVPDTKSSTLPSPSAMVPSTSVQPSDSAVPNISSMMAGMSMEGVSPLKQLQPGTGSDVLSPDHTIPDDSSQQAAASSNTRFTVEEDRFLMQYQMFLQMHSMQQMMANTQKTISAMQGESHPAASSLQNMTFPTAPVAHSAPHPGVHYVSAAGPHGPPPVAYGAPAMPHGVPTLPYGALPYGASAMPHGPTAMPHGASAMPHGPTAMPHGASAMPHGPTAISHGASAMPHGASAMPHAAGVPYGATVPQGEMLIGLHGETSVPHAEMTIPHGAMPHMYPAEQHPMYMTGPHVGMGRGNPMFGLPSYVPAPRNIPSIGRGSMMNPPHE